MPLAGLHPETEMEGTQRPQSVDCGEVAHVLVHEHPSQALILSSRAPGVGRRIKGVKQ